MNALVVSGDPALVDDLLRLGAAADADVVVARNAEEARSWWRHAPLVLVGADLLGRGMPRRPGVVLVARDEREAVFRAAVELGAEQVAVLPEAEPMLIGVLAAAAEPAGVEGLIVGVTGARGGAGASVLASVLALTAARRGFRPLLVDGDPLGGGLDLILGLEQADGLRWPGLAERRGRLSAAALREALPSVRGVSLLSHDRGEPVRVPGEAVNTVLNAAIRGFDLVIVDLARGAAVEASRTFVLAPAEVRAAVAARTIAGSQLRHCDDVRLIVRGPSRAGLTSAAVAEAAGLPLAGQYAFDRRIPPAAERGTMPLRGPLGRLCAQLVDDLR
ncbi:MAG: septum site-determining protein Ssd [Streptosporangiaceae bacterium]